MPWVTGPLKAIEPGYPLAPHYVVHVGDDGTVLLAFHSGQAGSRPLKAALHWTGLPDASACARFDKMTKDGKDMGAAQELLAKAVASIVGKKEERAVASLFTPGGTHAMKGEFQGINDFEVVAFLVVLPEAAANDLRPGHRFSRYSSRCPSGPASAQRSFSWSKAPQPLPTNARFRTALRR